jgi:hypothetical protein
MFDEVDDGKGNRYVLTIPEARGRSWRVLDIWRPVAEVSDLADGVEINAKIAGAIGDGVKDDTAVLQRCLDQALAAGGGTVFLPIGTYKTTDTLVVPAHVRLRGTGTGSKIKMATDAKPIVKLAGATAAVRSAVLDLWLGFKNAQTDPDGNGIQLADTGIMCYECEIANVVIDQPYNGIVCKNLEGGHAWMNVFRQVRVERACGYAFNLTNPDAGACTTTTFINCYAIQDIEAIKPTAGGFYIRNMTDCTLIGCAVDELDAGKVLYIMSSNATVIGLHAENCSLITDSASGLALFTISGSIANILGLRLENMVVNKANGECCTFDINTNSLVRISGVHEYNATKTAGDHYSVIPDGDTTAVYIENWRGMFGTIGEFAPPYKVRTLNGDNRTVTVGGKRRMYASAMPTTGAWTAGDYVENTNRAVAGAAGSHYIVRGWTRITTGEANALNTDWFEDRAPTGT